MKKTFYSGRLVNILIMFLHTTKKRYVWSHQEVRSLRAGGFHCGQQAASVVGKVRMKYFHIIYNTLPFRISFFIDTVFSFA